MYILKSLQDADTLTKTQIDNKKRHVKDKASFFRYKKFLIVLMKFMVSYYRQFSAERKMRNQTVSSSSVGPKEPKALVNKTGFS